MKAVLFEKFQHAPKVVTVADPSPAPHGVVLKVAATGVCRSDWHGWMGHDSDIDLPHVPGHELAGVVDDDGGESESAAAGTWQMDRRCRIHICG